MGGSLGDWPVMNNKNDLAHSNQNSTAQIIVTTRACRRHRDPLDYQHSHDSMQRYVSAGYSKVSKMKENEH
jgi:hypothetical protein